MRKIPTIVLSAKRYVRAECWKVLHPSVLAIFNWHQITLEFDPKRQHDYTWTQLGQFENQIKWLASHYKILPLFDAINQMRQGTLPGRFASLTFDDGDISIAECVLPVLKRHNLPATFFINSAYLNGRRTYWFPILNYLNADDVARDLSGFPEGLLDEGQQLRSTQDPSFYNVVRSRVEQYASAIPDLNVRLVSEKWLSNLDREQFTIGAHGHEHQRFSMMPSDWQRTDYTTTLRSCHNSEPIVRFLQSHSAREEIGRARQLRSRRVMV